MQYLVHASFAADAKGLLLFWFFLKGSPLAWSRLVFQNCLAGSVLQPGLWAVAQEGSGALFP